MANHDDPEVLSFPPVWINPEGFIGDFETNPIAREPAHDFGHVSVSAPGPIKGTNDMPFVVFVVIPGILGPISRRGTIPRRGFLRINLLGGNSAPAKGAHQQKY